MTEGVGRVSKGKSKRKRDAVQRVDWSRLAGPQRSMVGIAAAVQPSRPRPPRRYVFAVVIDWQGPDCDLEELFPWFVDAGMIGGAEALAESYETAAELVAEVEAYVAQVRARGRDLDVRWAVAGHCDYSVAEVWAAAAAEGVTLPAPTPEDELATLDDHYWEQARS